MHIIFTDLKCRGGVAGGVNGCEERWSERVWDSKIDSKTHSGLQQVFD